MNKELENEQPIKLKVKPIANKQFTKLSDMEDDTKNNRLKAFQIMKTKNIKQSLNQNLYDNLTEMNKPIHENIYINENEENEIKNERKLDDKSKNLFVLNKFEEYYSEKYGHNNSNEQPDVNIYNSNDKQRTKFDLEFKYVLGINTKSISSMCFHKDQKWVAFLNKNLVIIENFENDSNRTQKILKDSKSYLNTVKISENGSIIMAYSKTSDKTYPEIFFWDVKKDFELINKTVFKHKEIQDSEISMQNNFCAILSKF